MIDEVEFIVYPARYYELKLLYAIYKRPYLIPVTEQTFIELGVPVQYFKESYSNKELSRKVAKMLNKSYHYKRNAALS